MITRIRLQGPGSALCSAAAIGALLLVAAPAGARELVLGTALPGRHVVVREGLEPFVRELSAASGGRLSAVLHAGGSMGGWSESFDSAGSGLLDGASIVDTEVAAMLPLSNAISSLGMLGEDPRVMAGAVNELALVDSDAVAAEWRANGLRPIAGISLAPFYLFCSTAVDESTGFSGRRIRADSSYSSWVVAMDATPVNILSVELYEALQRRQVDCAIATGAWLKSFSLFDVVGSIVDQPLGLFFGAWALVLNADAWDQLSAADRALLLRLAPGIVSRSVEQYMVDDGEVREEARKRGIRVVQPTPELRDRLAAYRGREVERVIEQARRRGVAGAEPEIRRFLQLVEKWRGIVAVTGEDYDGYRAALVREVYSKVRP